MKHRVNLAGALAAVMLLAGCGAQVPPSASVAPDGRAVEGAMAPDFELPSAEGGSVKLSDYRGKKAVLLYFSMGPG